MIALMRGLIEGERKRVSDVLGEYGRRIHFRRKPALEKAVRGWNGRAAGDVLQHLQGAILETRKQPALQNSIARQALLAVALRSSKMGGR